MVNLELYFPDIFVVLFLFYQELHLMYVSMWHYPRQISLSKSNHDFQRHLFFTLCIKPIFTERWREYANVTRFTDLYKTEQMGFEVLHWQNKTNKESLKWVASCQLYGIPKQLLNTCPELSLTSLTHTSFLFLSECFEALQMVLFFIISRKNANCDELLRAQLFGNLELDNYMSHLICCRKWEKTHREFSVKLSLC